MNLQKNLLTVTEVEEAEKTILRFVQQESFPQKLDRARWLSGAYIKGSSLSKLKPFVEEGILRVGGRLNRVALSREVKHQINLPAKHCVTDMIICDFHQRNGHIGIQQTLAESRRYWIVNRVLTVRRVLQTCQVCCRLSRKLGEQITAPLPEIRVTSGKQRLIYPFAAVGTDYFGSFSIHIGPNTQAARKSPKTTKCYGCIFTCLRYQQSILKLPMIC